MENTPPQTLPVQVPMRPLPEKTRRTVNVDMTEMRIHELAVLRMLQNHYYVTEGYPVPVVFGTPGDAFSTFTQLSAAPNNPFAYLLDAKDEDGTPLYEPYPANVRYPIISVKRLGWQPSITRSWGIRRFRKLAYVSVSGNITRDDMANVAQQAMPTAWDFRYQIDHFAMRPETQADFIHRTMRLFCYAGGEMQTWIAVRYPGVFGRDCRMVRAVLSGSIDDASQDEPGDEPRQYRTSFSMTVEGYCPDLDTELWPTLWKGVIKEGTTVSPQELENLFTIDFRIGANNAVFNALPNLPPPAQ